MTNIYAKDVSNIKVLDPYRLQELYQMHPCAEHVVKKLLVAGEREGGKDLDTDISDCIRTLTRWQAMRAEDVAITPISAGIEATSADSVGRELVSQYDWTIAPLWARYAATDRDGSFFWYEQKPHIDEAGSCWNFHGYANCRCVSGGSQCSDWRNTLEARPQ